MQHQSAPQFFLSLENDCPYLAGNRERKLFTSLNKANPQHIQNRLSAQGFRRSQNIVYRPACLSCSSCLSSRIYACEFTSKRSQNRILKTNRDLVREVRKCTPTEEQYELFHRYVSARHPNGGMSDMSMEEFGAMVGDPLVAARIIEYRIVENGRPGALVAACLTDIITDGVSMVYSFFDPEMPWRSLGNFMILDHIDLCKSATLDYVYLGYWVKNSPNMSYKAQFAPLELFVNDKWQKFEDPTQADPEITDSQSILLKAHRALFNVPES